MHQALQCIIDLFVLRNIVIILHDICSLWHLRIIECQWSILLQQRDHTGCQDNWHLFHRSQISFHFSWSISNIHDTNNNANMSTWICDSCNSASFTTYYDACAHEEICKRRLHLAYIKWNLKLVNQTKSSFLWKMNDNQLREDVHSSTSSDNPKCATGCLALSVEPADNEWFLELNCFLCKYYVEAFSQHSKTLSRLLNMIELSRINPTPFKDLGYQIVRPTIGTAFKCQLGI